jgi:hypothetical protein
MPTIDQPRLRIDADAVGANPQATLTVTYDVHFSESDVAANQQYRETWRIVGADGSPGEDGTDDTVQSIPAASPSVIFGPDGAEDVTREIVIERDLSDLDEDPGANQDEIKVEVFLTPVNGFSAAATSNRVLVNA